MGFWIQHGYGKSDKIELLKDRVDFQGVVLSSSDEDIPTLTQTASVATSRDLEVLVDPQSYLYSTSPQGRGRCHEVNGIGVSNLSWGMSAADVEDTVEAVEKLNMEVNPDGRWIAPAPLQSSFSDLWTPLAIQLGSTASQRWGRERTIATLAVTEEALDDWDAMQRWLDVATTVDTDGYYILVSRQATSYPGQRWPPRRLMNLLRLIYALRVLNEYGVIWGYSDIEGLLGEAIGGDSASGWSYTLRQFSAAKWMVVKSGGSPATVRTHVARLWSLPRAESEVALMFDSDLREQLFTPIEIKKYEQEPFSSISRKDAQVDHLETLARKSNTLRDKAPAMTDKLDILEQRLDAAVNLWRMLDDEGFAIDSLHLHRSRALAIALSDFRDAEGL